MINIYFWDTNWSITNRKDTRFLCVDSEKRIYRIEAHNLTEFVFIIKNLTKDYDIMFKDNAQYDLFAWVDGKGKKFTQR